MDQVAEPYLPVTEHMHRLICGDCLTVLPTIDTGSVDAVVTSPPHNFSLSYRGYDNRRREDDCLDWLMRVAYTVHWVMKADASFFINIPGSSSARRLPFELIVRPRSLFVLQSHIIWTKSSATRGDAMEHFKPVGEQRFLHHNHEHIFHLTLTGDIKLDRSAISITFRDKSNIARSGHVRDLRCHADTWSIPYDTVQSKVTKFHYPSTFRAALPRWWIWLHGHDNPILLDPFMGAGMTLAAAELEGASGADIDMNRTYVAIAPRHLVDAGHVQPNLAGA